MLKCSEQCIFDQCSILTKINIFKLKINDFSLSYDLVYDILPVS